MDIEDVVASIKRSRELYEEAGIVRDTDVAANNAMAAAKSAPGEKPAAKPADEPADEDAKPPGRVLSMQRG